VIQLQTKFGSSIFVPQCAEIKLHLGSLLSARIFDLTARYFLVQSLELSLRLLMRSSNMRRSLAAQLVTFSQETILFTDQEHWLERTLIK